MVLEGPFPIAIKAIVNLRNVAQMVVQYIYFFVSPTLVAFMKVFFFILYHEWLIISGSQEFPR